MNSLCDITRPWQLSTWGCCIRKTIKKYKNSGINTQQWKGYVISKDCNLVDVKIMKGQCLKQKGLMNLRPPSASWDCQCWRGTTCHSTYTKRTNQSHQGNGEQFTTKKWSLTKMVSDVYRVLAELKNWYGNKDTRFTKANDGMAFMTTGNEEKKGNEKKRLCVTNVENQGTIPNNAVK